MGAPTKCWVERGQGRPLVFLHGYPLTHKIFTPQLESLSRDNRVVLLDLPGYGLATAQSLPESLSGFSDRVHEFLADQFATPVTLVGHSFGGYVALELTRKFPERVAALVLADTRSAADTPGAREKRLATVERLREAGQRLDPSEVVRGLLAPATWEKNRLLVERLERIVATVDSPTAIATLQAIADRPDLTPSLGAIRVPTLVVWGEEDRLIPPAESQSMVAQVPDCLGVGIANAGHLPSLEAPDVFSQAVLALLARLGAGSSA